MIIGPFSAEDWLHMLDLKGIIELMKERNSNHRYDLGIKAETERFNSYKNRQLAA